MQRNSRTHVGSSGCALSLTWRRIAAARSALVCCGEFAGELLRNVVSIGQMTLMPESRGSEG